MSNNVTPPFSAERFSIRSMGCLSSTATRYVLVFTRPALATSVRTFPPSNGVRFPKNFISTIVYGYFGSNSRWPFGKSTAANSVTANTANSKYCSVFIYNVAIYMVLDYCADKSYYRLNFNTFHLLSVFNEHVLLNCLYAAPVERESTIINRANVKLTFYDYGNARCSTL